MKKMITRIVILMGMLMALAGYMLNRLAFRYQGLYRSLQFRNIKLEEHVMTPDVKHILLIFVATLLLFVMAHCMFKKRYLIKQNGIAIFATVICAGQIFKILLGNSTEQLGLYVLLLGYLTMFVGFLLSLYEKESGKHEV